MAVHLRADGEAIVLAPANGRTFTLQELQTLVGGYIEVHVLDVLDEKGHGGRWYLVLNEDGQRLQLPPNVNATIMLHRHHRATRPGEVVVGDGVVCSHLELEGPDEKDE